MKKKEKDPEIDWSQLTPEQRKEMEERPKWTGLLIFSGVIVLLMVVCIVVIFCLR